MRALGEPVNISSRMRRSVKEARGVSAPSALMNSGYTHPPLQKFSEMQLPVMGHKPHRSSPAPSTP